MSKLPTDREREALLVHFFEASLALTEEEEREYNRLVEELEPAERAEIIAYTNSWKEEGRVEGLTKGLVEGRLEGERKIVVQLLQHRLGSEADEFEDAVSKLTEERLTELAEAAINFKTAADARTWFASKR